MSSAPPRDAESTSDPLFQLLTPLHACLYRPPLAEPAASSSGTLAAGTLTAVAEQFSPRYERHHDDLVSIDVSGLERLLGQPRTIGEELRREAAARGIRAHVAVAHTRMAALVVALARPGLTVVPRGEEAAALAPVDRGYTYISALWRESRTSRQSKPIKAHRSLRSKWGLKTLREVAALPPPIWSHASAAARSSGRRSRGEDIHPLVPTLAEERFESSIELEWPIEELEPLSFVLTRLLEPLSTRLRAARSRRGGAARAAAARHPRAGDGVHAAGRGRRRSGTEPAGAGHARAPARAAVADARRAHAADARAASIWNRTRPMPQ